MSSRQDESWSETTLPIVEKAEPHHDSTQLCLVLAFDRTKPTSAPVRFVSDVPHIAVGRGAATALDPQTQRISVCDPSISARHFTLTRENKRWTLVDQDSRNGTYVNGVRVARHSLQNDDVIEAGACYFVAVEATGDTTGTMRTLAPQSSTGFDSLIPALARQLARLDRLARSALPIHIHGETGTGKEVVAQEIHRRSGRTGKFVAVNCGALPDALITAELFGAKRGAYSGATTDREGLIKASSGGTLFLDEIAELSLPSQAALLRVLQEREVTPVGGTVAEPCNLRVVSATNRDLDDACNSGSFRRDLYARLYGADVVLPPLRDRRADLGLLIGRLLVRAGREDHITFTRAAARALFTYDWRCNVRELQRALELAMAAFDPGTNAIEISESHLSLAVQTDMQQSSKSDPSRFRDLAHEYAGNVTALSRALGTSRSHVRRLAQRYACDLDAFRAST